MKLACCALAMAGCLGAQSFDAVSVKPSSHTVGPDYNNRIHIGPASLSAKNVTLKRLIADAYSVQAAQLSGGPKWLAQGEFDVEAKFDPATRAQLPAMLQAMLRERFHLAVHRETRDMRVWELVVDKAGAKLHRADSDEPAGPAGSSHFRCTLAQLAELIAVQLSIVPVDDPARPGVASGSPVPVMDRTGLDGVYDFQIEGRPEADPAATWQRILEGLGLKLQLRRAPLELLVVDSVDRTPSEN